MSLSAVPVCSRAANAPWKSAKPSAWNSRFRGILYQIFFYILRRDRGAEKTISFLRHLLSISTVSPVAHTDALRALDFALGDFEDALQLSAAESRNCGADVILTRNKGDFGSPANIAVMTPEEFAPLAPIGN